MLRIFSRNKTVQSVQEKFFKYLEKIVNITVVKTESCENETVKDILNDLGAIFRDFWKLKETNPDKFSSILWSRDFYENYVHPLEAEKSFDTDKTQDTKDAEKLREDASLRLFFGSARELKGLTQFLNCYKRIWEAALKNGNDEISRYTIYQIVDLLEGLSKEPVNNLFIEQFLKLLNSITWIAIRSSENRKDLSLHSAAVEWYTDIVFNRWGDLEKEFNLDYLDLFNRHFFISAKYIITENREDVFRVLVSSVVDGTGHFSHHATKVWEYYHLFLNRFLKECGKIADEQEINKKLDYLTETGNDINSEDHLNDWLYQFNKVKDILETASSKNEPLEEAEKLEIEIKGHIISQYKYNRLMEIVASIAIYCLFKKKFNLIRLLWEYKQPPDSDGQWVGPDVIPDNIDKVMSFLILHHLAHRRVELWEGHHGGETYYRQYSVLLLARVAKSFEPHESDKYQNFVGYKIPARFNDHLSSIEYLIDHLISSIPIVTENKEMLDGLGFESVDVDGLFNKKLVPFFNNIKAQTKERLKNIERIRAPSSEKIEEFKNQIVEEFNESTAFRQILKRYECYNDMTSDRTPVISRRFGINRIDDKAIFFKQWHVHYGNWGKHYGDQLAAGEDRNIAEQLYKFCNKPDESKFDNILKRFDEPSKVIILTPHSAIYDYFHRTTKFQPKWADKKTDIEIHGFEGYYLFSDTEIPVFNIFNLDPLKQVLILDMAKVGEFFQYSPLDEGEGKDLMKDVFFMDVQTFSENKALMDEFIENPPLWLKELGSETQQREFLEKKALIKILERFEINKGKEFKGYCIDARELS